jgi:ZipA, C-terminal FtsZ-binding domain
MSLSTALAVLGGVVLLAIAAQLWWSGKRSRPRAPLESLPPGDRVDPQMGAADGYANTPDGAARDGPNLEDEPASLRLPQKKPPRLDALIDAIVPLALESPITGELALAHLPTSRRAGGKPFYIEGLDAETGEWAVLTPGRRYGELQAGVQLANRSGPLNEIEYSEFMQKVQAFAEAVGASVDGADAPDMLEVVARARELDGLTTPLDAQLTVTLRSNSVAWAVPYVQQIATRLGFVPGTVPGRLVMPSLEEGAPPVLVLSIDSQAAMAALGETAGATAAASVRECTLSLDVPQTPVSAEPFPAWHRAATKLADDLDATVVDDQQQPVNLHAFVTIGQALDGLYQQLATMDLAAGSAAARRLFS